MDPEHSFLKGLHCILLSKGILLNFLVTVKAAHG